MSIVNDMCSSLPLELDIPFLAFRVKELCVYIYCIPKMMFHMELCLVVLQTEFKRPILHHIHMWKPLHFLALFSRSSTCHIICCAMIRYSGGYGDARSTFWLGILPFTKSWNDYGMMLAKEAWRSIEPQRARASSDLCGSDTVLQRDGPIPRPLAASTHHGPLIFERGATKCALPPTGMILYFWTVVAFKKCVRIWFNISYRKEELFWFGKGSLNFHFRKSKLCEMEFIIYLSIGGPKIRKIYFGLFVEFLLLNSIFIHLEIFVNESKQIFCI